MGDWRSTGYTISSDDSYGYTPRPQSYSSYGGGYSNGSGSEQPAVKIVVASSSGSRGGGYYQDESDGYVRKRGGCGRSFGGCGGSCGGSCGGRCGQWIRPFPQVLSCGPVSGSSLTIIGTASISGSTTTGPLTVNGSITQTGTQGSTFTSLSVVGTSASPNVSIVPAGLTVTDTTNTLTTTVTTTTIGISSGTDATTITSGGILSSGTGHVIQGTNLVAGGPGTTASATTTVITGTGMTGPGPIVVGTTSGQTSALSSTTLSIANTSATTSTALTSGSLTLVSGTSTATYSATGPTTVSSPVAFYAGNTTGVTLGIGSTVGPQIWALTQSSPTGLTLPGNPTITYTNVSGYGFAFSVAGTYEFSVYLTGTGTASATLGFIITRIPVSGTDNNTYAYNALTLTSSGTFQTSFSGLVPVGAGDRVTITGVASAATTLNSATNIITWKRVLG